MNRILGMEPKNGILVSVVVITYNQEKCLPKTLDSLLAQQCSFQYEIIVSDDCSKDNTRKVMEEYAANYPCIKPYCNEKNLGLVGNYINAISKCKGKYVAMCDGDDLWNDTSKIQKQVDVLESDDRIGLVYTDVVIDSAITGERYVRRCQDPQDDLFTQLLIGNFITISTACFRSELLQYVDFASFIENGFIMQDYPMWLSFCHHTRFCRIPEPMVTYRIDHKVVNTDEVSLHACRFDENTTEIRLHYLKQHPESTILTEKDLLDAHYRIGYRSGLNTNDRQRTLDYVRKISHKSKYEKRLKWICGSKILFNGYLKYRSMHIKPKSQLEMYFGN
ncbi:MAG: glycosyltransferase [Bacteroidales bacterium]|nr:glycosyltransferase [Bacteroidales bacterium]